LLTLSKTPGIAICIDRYVSCHVALTEQCPYHSRSVRSTVRARRSAAAIALLLLCILIGVERRVAEATIDAVPVGPALLSLDALDGEEIIIRLVAAADANLPAVDAPSLLVFERLPSITTQPVSKISVLGASPRGPP
jgi:hypothetical protein